MDGYIYPLTLWEMLYHCISTAEMLKTMTTTEQHHIAFPQVQI